MTFNYKDTFRNYTTYKDAKSLKRNRKDFLSFKDNKIPLNKKLLQYCPKSMPLFTSNYMVRWENIKHKHFCDQLTGALLINNINKRISYLSIIIEINQSVKEYV